MGGNTSEDFGDLDVGVLDWGAVGEGRINRRIFVADEGEEVIGCLTEIFFLGDTGKKDDGNHSMEKQSRDDWVAGTKTL